MTISIPASRFARPSRRLAAISCSLPSRDRTPRSTTGSTASNSPSKSGSKRAAASKPIDCWLTNLLRDGKDALTVRARHRDHQHAPQQLRHRSVEKAAAASKGEPVGLARQLEPLCATAGSPTCRSATRQGLTARTRRKGPQWSPSTRLDIEIINTAGNVTCRNSFVTDLGRRSERTSPSLPRAGVPVGRSRTRPSTLLKNNDYHLRHNFGHGKENLSGLARQLEPLDCLRLPRVVRKPRNRLGKGPQHPWVAPALLRAPAHHNQLPRRPLMVRPRANPQEPDIWTATRQGLPLKQSRERPLCE